MATTAMGSGATPGFFKVPGEVRNIIYGMLLTTKEAYHPISETQDSVLPHYELAHALLQVNLQIYEESLWNFPEGEYLDQCHHRRSGNHLYNNTYTHKACSECSTHQVRCAGHLP